MVTEQEESPTHEKPNGEKPSGQTCQAAQRSG